MFTKLRAIIESGVFSFILFHGFVLLYSWLLQQTDIGNTAVANEIEVVLLIGAYYLTAVFCGYWAGWRSKTDGWIIGIIGYALFSVIRINISAQDIPSLLPYPFYIKLLVGYIPILTLLMFGGIIGEQRAHYAPASQKNMIIYPLIKRILDFAASIFVLMFLAPIMFAIAIGIKLASPGPVFFHQKRVGQHGRIINIIKFRTMMPDADSIIDRFQLFSAQDEDVCQIQDDPRVFPFGKFLRTTSLDELPQLINISKGEMSLVGPRPLVPEELETSDDDLKRLEVKPGLTGLAQVNGRGNITFGERLALDIEYVDNQSFFLDLKVMLLTLWQVLSRRGAF
ncbi:MAG TPA: TIGR04086 family membrane protein [Actinobacteria bacterium]|nr:TIGR04086 family membrane protein [Actinomycetota bacterium]